MSRLHEHLEVLLKPTTCSSIIGHDFNPHNNQVVFPTFLPTSTQRQSVQINATHKEEL